MDQPNYYPDSKEFIRSLPETVSNDYLACIMSERLMRNDLKITHLEPERIKAVESLLKELS